MTYYYIIKDGKLEGRTTTRESALTMIEISKENDFKHYLLKPEYSIIKGEQEEFIKWQLHQHYQLI